MKSPECGRPLSAPIPKGRSKSGRYNLTEKPKFKVPNPKSEI